MAEQLKLDLDGRHPRRVAIAELPADLRPEPIEAAKQRAQSLTRKLSIALDGPVRLIVTDNRRTMVSARRDRGTMVIRVHHMFLRADEATIAALAQYVGRGTRKASAALDVFIAHHNGALDAVPRRPSTLRTLGEHHDLSEILGALADRHFGGPVDARITWGRRSRRRGRRRSIQLGTYLAEERLIRIHPVLDQDWVPRFYVEAVVFHELLHHDMPCVVKNGRRWFHTKEFRDRERAFEHHMLAEEWERKHISRLLRGS